MKYRYLNLGVIFCAAFLCFAEPLWSQNFDPTVNVTRDFEAKLLDVDKPSLRINIPDSVTRFNLDFDYTVLDNPYKGFYEFSPYVVQLRPEPDSYRERKLWVSAGAGYSLHPELDLVWSPYLKGDFRMSLYANHHSYFGNYRQISGLWQSTSHGAWYADKSADSKTIYWKGYDSQTVAGLDGRYSWNGGRLDYDFSYFGLATSDVQTARHYDAAELSFRVRSMKNDYSYFFYDVDLNAGYGVDSFTRFNNPCYNSFGSKVKEFLVSVNSSMGPVMGGDHSFIIDIDGEVLTYGSSLESYAGQLAVTPKYCYSGDRFSIEAGVRVDLMARPPRVDSTTIYPLMKHAMNRQRGQVVYPSVRMDLVAVEDYLDIYARIGGGNELNPYSRMMKSNHHFSAAYYNGITPLLDNSVERISASLGFRGNFSKYVNYDIKGGWRYNESAPLDALCGLLPSLVFASYQNAFAGFKIGVNTEIIRFDAWADYNWTNLRKLRTEAFEPSCLTAGFKCSYNWKSRLYAAVFCDASASRRGYVNVDSVLTPVLVPWFSDLGLEFSYSFSNGLSLWAKASNLLNQTIQRNFAYAEQGVNCTLGVSFSL